jgi:hypothetical protein
VFATDHRPNKSDYLKIQAQRMNPALSLDELKQHKCDLCKSGMEMWAYEHHDEWKDEPNYTVTIHRTPKSHAAFFDAYINGMLSHRVSCPLQAYLYAMGNTSRCTLLIRLMYQAMREAERKTEQAICSPDNITRVLFDEIMK